MKLIGRGGRADSGPELEARLRDVLDDRRSPGAPETLYDYLREVPMEPTTEPGRWRLWSAWAKLGMAQRAAAALVLVAMVAAGALAVRVAGPELAPAGAGLTAGPIPSRPPAPAGWVWAGSFGQSGPDGIGLGANILEPAPRIAIHVVCTGPDQLIVFAYTQGPPPMTDGGPFQAATFGCEMAGHEGRVEFTAPSGVFREVYGVVVRHPSSIVDTSFVISIEVPDPSTAPSPTR